MSMNNLVLKKNEERRLRSGHLWIYSNEVDTRQTALSEFTAGELVEVLDSQKKSLGYAYVNPNTLICARIMSRDKNQQVNSSLLVHRIQVALSLRERVYDKPFYRLVYGESDRLPGLVVDRFDDVLVVQLNTAGMECLREEVLGALDKVIKPRAIVLRNDASARSTEGLQPYTECALGTLPDEVLLEENQTRFVVPVLEGQKTGWFYDHRENRARMQRYVNGKRVLDVFSYVGGWGVQAAQAGASDVTCVDASATALDGVEYNARLNGCEGRVNAIEGDAFEALKALRAEREHYDVIIVDPPAFIKRKKDLRKGTEAYRRINQMAMQLLERDGILFSASCSYHLKRESLRDNLLAASRHLDRNMQIIEQGAQAMDHPVHPAIIETDYIKCFTCRITSA